MLTWPLIVNSLCTCESALKDIRTCTIHGSIFYTLNNFICFVLADLKVINLTMFVNAGLVDQLQWYNKTFGTLKLHTIENHTNE